MTMISWEFANEIYHNLFHIINTFLDYCIMLDVYGLFEVSIFS